MTAEPRAAVPPFVRVGDYVGAPVPAVHPPF